MTISAVKIRAIFHEKFVTGQFWKPSYPWLYFWTRIRVKFLLENCVNLDRRNGPGKSMIWSWKVMEKSWNFVSKILLEPCKCTPSNVLIFQLYISYTLRIVCTFAWMSSVNHQPYLLNLSTLYSWQVTLHIFICFSHPVISLPYFLLCYISSDCIALRHIWSPYLVSCHISLLRPRLLHTISFITSNNLMP